MPSRVPRIAAVGMASWDRFLVVDRYPDAGSYEVVRDEFELPGGTTTNTAVALSRLGIDVSLTAMTGDDTNGSRIREGLAAETRIDTGGLGIRATQRTDASTIIVSTDPVERTIYWHQGVRLERGDRLDIAAMFDHDVILLDVASAPLRRWLTDLPAHTSPRCRLLGTLTYVAGNDERDNLEVMMRHDAVVGSERETLLVTGSAGLEAATRKITDTAPGSNLRAWIITRGPSGCRVVTRDEVLDIESFPVSPVDVTGAGDAFAAGIAYGMARRWDWTRTGRLANGLGALTTRALGAQTALPTLQEVAEIMTEPASTLFGWRG